MDSFTCGTCDSTFTALDVFLNHKQSGCVIATNTTNTATSASIEATTAATTSDASTDEGTQGLEVVQVIQSMKDELHLQSLATASAPSYVVKLLPDAQTVADGVEGVEGESPSTDTTPNVANNKLDIVVNNENNKSDSANGSKIYVCHHCDAYSGSLQEITSHFSKDHGVFSTEEDITANIRSFTPLDRKNCPPVTLQRHPTPRKRGRPRKNPASKLTQTASVVGIGNKSIPIMTMVHQEPDSHPASDTNPKPRRRPGRPRKSEQAPPPISSEELKKKEVKELQSFWDDENLTCRNCKMKFSRIRQLHSHRCMIDVLEREGLHQSDEESSRNSPDGDDVKMTDSSTAVKVSEKKPKGILKIDVTEEEQIQIEQAICEHEIPQVVNDKAPSHPNKFIQNSLKVYTCPYCEKFFKFKQGMILHIRSHTNYKPFKCSWCDYSSAAKGNLKTHERKHTGERFKCHLCSYTTISRGHLKMHTKTHKKVRILCELCHKNVYTLTNLLRHLEASHKIDDPGKARSYYEKKKLQTRAGRRSLLFQCNICNRKFKTQREHDTHLLLHQEKKPFLCTLCDYRTVKKVYLDQHIRKHRQVYLCSVCKDKHLSIQLLKDHLASHATTENGGLQDEQQQLFVDSIHCSLYFAEMLDQELESARLNRVSSGDLDAAAVDFLQDTTSQDATSGTGDNQSKNGAEYGGKDVTKDELKEIFGIDQCMLRYKRLNMPTFEAIQKLYGEQECRSCGKLFMFKTHLENHTKIHSEDKEFKCSHENCSYSAHSQENMKVHEECAHSGIQYKCAECGFETRTKLYLQTHMRKHVAPDAFKCTRCDAKFGKEKAIKNHIADNHPGMLQEEIEKIIGRKTHIYRKQGQEWFQCEHCPLKFRKMAELRQHLWMHQGLTPYKCEICGHGTRSLCNLKAHMLRHSHAKTHLCDECGKSFKTKNSLKVHVMSQHLEAGRDKTTYKITVKCHYCDFTCVQRSQLKKHLELHTGNRPYKCGVCVQHFSNTKCGLRSHYSKQHPDVEIDESLLEEQEAEIAAEQQTVMHYKCTQCGTLCDSYQVLEQHLLKAHNLEIATSSEEVTNSEEVAAAALIQAAAMAESSIQEVQEVADSGLQNKVPVPFNSAAELLQQIISMQGLGQLPSGGNQVQIQLPISHNITTDATGVEDAVYSITQSIGEAQPSTSNTSSAIQTYAVSQGTQQIMEGQAHDEEDSSSIMQVRFQVEGAGGAEQFFVTEGGEDVEQQVVVVKDGEDIEPTYMEVAPDIQQAEVVQVAISSDDAVNQSENHQASQVIIDAVNQSENRQASQVIFDAVNQSENRQASQVIIDAATEVIINTMQTTE